MKNQQMLLFLTLLEGASNIQYPLTSEVTLQGQEVG
jgi:hypothetical protein